MMISIAAKAFFIAQAAYSHLETQSLKSTKALIHSKLEESLKSGHFTPSQSHELSREFFYTVRIGRIEHTRVDLRNKMYLSRLCLMLGDHTQVTKSESEAVTGDFVIESITFIEKLMAERNWPFMDAAAEFSGRTGLAYEPESEADFLNYLQKTKEAYTAEKALSEEITVPATSTETGFFVVSQNYPVAGFDLKAVSMTFAGEAASTKIFATQAKAAEWVGAYISVEDVGMVVPVSELASYFNGAEKQDQKEAAFTDSFKNLREVIEREGIDLNTIEFKPWVEKFSTYTQMQQDNIEAGRGFHEGINYCAVQMFVNGEYRFDIAWRRAWSEVVVLAEKCNQRLKAMKIKRYERTEHLEARAAFLAEYAEEIGDNPSATENILMRMFALAGDQLPIHNGKVWFFKAWREVDVIDASTSDYDMMVWDLIANDNATHAVVDRLITAP